MQIEQHGDFCLIERASGWEIRTVDAALIAHIVMTDDDQVRVTWYRSIPLPPVYTTAHVALVDLVMWESRPRGGTKPIPIPHLAPPKA